jgi:signal transduction histidine kinase
VLLQDADDLLFRETAAPHVLVLSMGQNELQTGLSQRGNVRPAVHTLAFVALSIVLLSFWAVRAVIGPLERTAEAARRYSVDDLAQPIAESGPKEVRQLAVAINQMQARISKLVGDRTRVVAAMSHDLRTPITRLRMRADYMDDTAQRQGMISDLDQMERMVHGALAYLRDGRTGEALIPTELPSVLETIRDQYADIGVTIAYEGPDSLRIRIRPSEIERAVTNLVENALKYGGSASLRLTQTADGVAIEIEDRGPGIPEDQREAMLEPFARGDVARALDDKTGFGLGLTIARAIASAHGGQLTRRGAQPNGLIARLELPMEP